MLWDAVGSGIVSAGAAVVVVAFVVDAWRCCGVLCDICVTFTEDVVDAVKQICCRCCGVLCAPLNDGLRRPDAVERAVDAVGCCGCCGT